MTNRILFPAVFIFSFAVFFTLHMGFLNRNYNLTTTDAVIKITKGDNLRSVAQKLEDTRSYITNIFS